MNEVFESIQSSEEVGSLPNCTKDLNLDFYLGRPPLLSEYLPDHPKKLLKEVFASYSKCDSLKEQLAEWLGLMGVFEPTLRKENKPDTYQNGFYKELPELIQALYGFRRNLKDVDDFHGFRQVIIRFCRQFPRSYAQRELWCFTNAAVVLSGDNQMQHTPDKVLEWYEQVSCLAEAAYLLSNDFANELVM